MNWTIDAGNSAIGFSVKHLMVSTVKGRFRKVAGKIEWDENNPANSVIEAEVEAVSVETGDPNRDKHLRSADFFNVAKYPTLTFKSRRIQKISLTRFRLTGDLTIRNITREVAFEVEYIGRSAAPFQSSASLFRASTRLNRKAFGLGWSAAMETGGMLVGDEVKVELVIRAVKEAVVETAEIEAA